MSLSRKRGAIEFEAAGKPFVLRLTTNAQVRFKEAQGRSIIKALAEMETSADPDLGAIRAMFQHCLTPEVTADEAGDIMDEVGILEAARLIAEAASLAYPTPDPRPAPPSKATLSTPGSAPG